MELTSYFLSLIQPFMNGLLNVSITVFVSAAASKNRPSNGVNESSGDSQASGAEDGSIPEGELLLQVGASTIFEFNVCSPVEEISPSERDAESVNAATTNEHFLASFLKEQNLLL